MPVQPAFIKFPDEATIVGRLLGGYALVELDLFNCVHMGLGDFNKALKGMFRTRGEKRRIENAKKLARSSYAAHGLDADFDDAIEAMHNYRKIRNQYAHRLLYDDGSGKLTLIDLEGLAKLDRRVPDLKHVARDYIDIPTLLAQEEYALTTDWLIRWVNWQRQYLVGIAKVDGGAKPVLPSTPPLHL